MKKLILTVALSVACLSALAQGTVNFANVGAGGLNAPVYLNSIASGEKLAGAAYVAQLWAGPAGATEAQLQPMGPLATFLTGAQSGWFTGGARTITGVDGGAAANLQVRAWNASAGATWAEARGAANGITGASSIVTITLSVPPATPPNMLGLQSFAIVPVPEPSTFALAGLGAAALLIFRRRK